MPLRASLNTHTVSEWRAQIRIQLRECECECECQCECELECKYMLNYKYICLTVESSRVESSRAESLPPARVASRISIDFLNGGIYYGISIGIWLDAASEFRICILIHSRIFQRIGRNLMAKGILIKYATEVVVFMTYFDTVWLNIIPCLSLSLSIALSRSQVLKETRRQTLGSIWSRVRNDNAILSRCLRIFLTFIEYSTDNMARRLHSI